MKNSMFFEMRKSLIAGFTLIMALLGVSLGGVSVLAQPTIYRVAPNGAASGSCGGAWSNPCDLQYALSTLASADSELWLQQGTYKPGNDRTSSFVLKDQVAIYGGFAGTETSRDQRDPSTHVTILSGDVNGDDNGNIAFDEPTRAENVVHVISSNGVGSNARLDGLTITGGNANLNFENDAASGGGMWNGSGDPLLMNVIFTANTARELGGGMFIENSDRPGLIDVTFTNNVAEGGGGLANYQSSPLIFNTLFAGNIATRSGGGISNWNGSYPTLEEVTFEGNISGGVGGAMGNHDSSPKILRSTFNDNHVYGFNELEGRGGAIYNSNSDPTIENTTVSGNTALYGGSGVANENSDPTFTNVTFTGNWDAIQNIISSHPVVRNSILWGNIDPDTGVVSTIFDGGLSSTTVTESVIQNDFPGGTNIITTDPLLGSLGNYSGNTRTIPLFPGSSAIDRGNPLYCPATDQRNIARPQGTGCDIGAFEYAEGLVVTVTRGPNTPTPTRTVTFPPLTFIPATPCRTPTASASPTGTTTFIPSTPTLTLTASASPTGTPTGTATGTATLGYTLTPSQFPSATQTRTDTPIPAPIRTSPPPPDKDTTGVFRPTNGLLYLKNSNNTGFADIALNYGLPSDYPVVGDWNGDGTVTIGVYRQGYFYLKSANTLGFADVVFPFGKTGDQPVAGDWNGDGVDTIGVYRPSTGQFLLRNSNSEGAEDASFYLGNPGDVGIAGDWDGDGKDTTGVFRPSNGLLYLKNKNDTGFADMALNYGLPGDRPVTGDWDGDGIDTIGVYRQGQFMLRNSNTIGFAENIFGLGNPGDMPIAGNWDGLP